MLRARLWIAEKLLAAARAVAGAAPEPAIVEFDDEEEDEGRVPAAALSRTALAMILEGEAAAEAALERALAERRKVHEPDAPRAGSLQERIATARRNA